LDVSSEDLENVKNTGVDVSYENIETTGMDVSEN